MYNLGLSRTNGMFFNQYAKLDSIKIELTQFTIVTILMPAVDCSD